MILGLGVTFHHQSHIPLLRPQPPTPDEPKNVATFPPGLLRRPPRPSLIPRHVKPPHSGTRHVGYDLDSRIIRRTIQRFSLNLLFSVLDPVMTRHGGRPRVSSLRLEAGPSSRSPCRPRASLRPRARGRRSVSGTGPSSPSEAPPFVTLWRIPQCRESRSRDCPRVRPKLLSWQTLKVILRVTGRVRRA